MYAPRAIHRKAGGAACRASTCNDLHQSTRLSATERGPKSLGQRRPTDAVKEREGAKCKLSRGHRAARILWKSLLCFARGFEVAAILLPHAPGRYPMHHFDRWRVSVELSLSLSLCII